MEIKTYDSSEQIDPAVDLGAVPPALPDIEFLRDFAANPPAPPPMLIEGTLHRGDKMILGGTSKSNKNWSLLDLALSVAGGQKWWGRQCTKTAVVYINFELQRWGVSRVENANEIEPWAASVFPAPSSGRVVSLYRDVVVANAGQPARQRL